MLLSNETPVRESRLFRQRYACLRPVFARKATFMAGLQDLRRTLAEPERGRRFPGVGDFG